MAIVRTEINGNFTALKTALQSTGLFDSVTLDNDSTPTLLTCKDADNNTLFTIGYSSSNWTLTAYKDASNSITLGPATVQTPLYFYKVGTDSAAIEFAYSHMLIIGKTNTGKVGFVFPAATATQAASKSEIKVACWGDDPTFTSTIIFANATLSNAATGNHSLFVPVPMHGTYNTVVYLPDVYCMPMAQPGLRNVLQEITGLDGTYLTNGFVAVKDKIGGATA